MRVEFKTEGGIAHFPGLSRPAVIEADALPPAEASELERLVERACFFDLREAPKPPRRGAADYQSYTITVDDGRRRHTVRLTDPVEDPDLQALLEFLRRAAREIRARERAGREGGG